MSWANAMGVTNPRPARLPLRGLGYAMATWPRLRDGGETPADGTLADAVLARPQEVDIGGFHEDERAL